MKILLFTIAAFMLSSSPAASPLDFSPSLSETELSEPAIEIPVVLGQSLSSVLSPEKDS